MMNAVTRAYLRAGGQTVSNVLKPATVASAQGKFGISANVSLKILHNKVI